MLTITKLRGAEYLVASVADGMEDYYMGAGEAPGVWRGRWAAELGVEGVVTAEALRALVNGLHPTTGADLLAGHRERKVRAIDVTLSVPKSVSLLWAFGSSETSAIVSIAVVEASDTALGFLDERAAVARVQEGGVRRRVGTDGFAIATFAHRTSRAGDPQLHTHCLIPNVVRRADGSHVALDANPLHVWAKATGTVFLNQLERILTRELGVVWGPERNGSRELVGFTLEQLRAFSKRTVAIEARLEARGELAFDSRRDRMRADDRASLATRARKDKALTPERLRERWVDEAAGVDLHSGAGVDDLVVGRQRTAGAALGDAEIFAGLVDPASGLCATGSRFCEAQVVERVAAISGGRLSVDEIVGVAQRFVGSELVVRLAAGTDRRRPPEWSTVEHRGVEDRLLVQLHYLGLTPGRAVDSAVVDGALAADPRRLGRDQADAVRVLCGAGPSVRVLVAPAGFGKTAALNAAAAAHTRAGRSVMALAPTHKAVAELRAAGLQAHTIAGFLVRLDGGPLPSDTTVIVDEVSQVGTRHAAALLGAVARSRGAQLWCVGDARQAQSVAAGGLAVELERLAAEGAIPAATLRHNRRQADPADRRALALLRAGAVDASRDIRTERGWEHEHASPAETRQTLAEAAIADADRHGAAQVAVLAVSHADCEDLADRIRAIRTGRGELRGPTLHGPGWGIDPRVYAAGDRVLVHANLNTGPHRHLFNGATGTVLHVGADGIQLLLDADRQVFLPATVIAGRRTDGTPNVSHAWARTVDGAQGGTWAQVHLLGTPALDHFTGYVGQSRGRQPTHTWNTRPEADHPASLLADERSPAEAVADALRRAEPKTLAAVDDPWLLDTQLRAERQDHAGVVAARPPDRIAELERARAVLADAAEEHHWATDSVAHFQQDQDRLGPLSRLRRGGRDDVARAEAALAGAHRRLERAAAELDHARAHVQRCQADIAQRAAWDETEGWRLGRMADIDDRLAHHWADVILRAVRADDPLGFGVDRLRAARATYRADLQAIVDRLPTDRRHALATAQAELQHHQRNLRHAVRTVARAREAVDHASQRRWGRRDNHAIEAATAVLASAESNYQLTSDAVAGAAKREAEEQRAVETWTKAMNDTTNDRARLTVALRDVTDALDHSRPERIVAAAMNPTSELWGALGPPPASRGGRAGWCGIAERIEVMHDRVPANSRSHPILESRPGMHDHHEWERLASLAANASDIIDTASRLDPTPGRQPHLDRAQWQPAVDAACRRIAIDQPAPMIDQGLGLEL